MPRLFSGKVIIYLLASLILDLSFMPVFRFGMVQPVLLYLVVLFAAFEWEWFKAVRIAFAAGMLRDLTGTLPLGVETCVLVTASFVLGYVIQKIERNSIFMRCLISAGYVFAVTLTAFIISAFLGFPYHLSWHVLNGALTTGLGTAVLAPIFFTFSRRWFHQQVSSLKQYELFS